MPSLFPDLRGRFELAAVDEAVRVYRLKPATSRLGASPASWAIKR
jgi:hypothetical protein